MKKTRTCFVLHASTSTVTTTKKAVATRAVAAAELMTTALLRNIFHDMDHTLHEGVQDAVIVVIPGFCKCV